MNWLARILGSNKVIQKPAADRLQGAVDRVVAPPTTALPRSGYLVNWDFARAADAVPLKRVRVGDFEAIEFPGHRAVVEFLSDCDCRVSIECATYSAAVYLAGALNMCATGCDVDVQLDKVLES